MDEPALIDSIYEAGAMPERWPALLHRLAELTGAASGMILAQTAQGLHGHESNRHWEHRAPYVEQGWDRDTTRLDWLLRDPWPGFRTDLDFATREELARIPVYADFLIPRGIDAGAATLIPGLEGDTLLLSMEAFADHEAARAAIPLLDRLRPHLARAMMLTARLRQAQAEAAVRALEIAGIGAALVGDRLQVRSSNARFRALAGDRAQPLLPAAVQRRLPGLVVAAGSGARGGSLPLSIGDDTAILHVLPVTGDARDVFAGCSALLVIAERRDGSGPDQQLIRLLYDLTPSEARVAAAIAAGNRVVAVARQLGIAEQTVRVHLKAVFAKTGLRSQAELAVRLTGLSALGSI